MSAPEEADTTDEGSGRVARRRYGPLAGSPFDVNESSRRERYWFSDGAWVEQGQTAAVVGVVWTHWLADRGLQVAGTRFDESFARDLYFASQQAMGQPADENTGSRLPAAGWVLQSRGLIDRCYLCPDTRTISLVLLERGPVLAGLSWSSDFDQPELVDGRLVCRLGPSATVRGGHAVLLNGISLDLELGGVKGFVRFKNSWGRLWGDAGQCLISIDDLTTALGDVEVLLPIPAKTALGPAGRQEVAIPEVAAPVTGTPAPDLVRYRQESIRSDVWTTTDSVGYTAYADAIARGIQHADTKPPLTIGLKAPWGAGKTSLMRMIQDRLEWPAGDQAGRKSGVPREVQLTKGSAQAWTSALGAKGKAGKTASKAAGTGDPSMDQVSNRTVLRAFRSRAKRQIANESAPALKAEPKTSPYEAEAADRWRPTVWFNPWLYQTGQQVWAGLAHQIIDQTTKRMSLAERELFWLRLNLRRLDEQAVRRKIYGLVLGRIIPLVTMAVFLLAVGLVVLASGNWHWVGVGLTAGSPVALAILIGLQVTNVLRAPAAGSLPAVVTPAVGVGRFAGEQLSGAFDELVRSPDYKSEAGFLYLVQADVREVLDLVAEPDRPIVVFIDDLDRCSPSTVVQVFEAINIFLAGEFPNAIFVIALEPQMVAAHIEAAFADLVRKLRETSESGEVDLGWKFLEKFIQLPLTLPTMVPDQTTVFFRSLFQQNAKADAADQVAPSSRAEASEFDEQMEQQLHGGSLSNVLNVAGTVPAEAGASAKGKVRRVVDQSLSLDNPEVQQMISYGTRFLDPNPRQIKRFVNLFRFFVMIDTERRLQQLPVPTSLWALAKLAVLATRWPALLGVLTESCISKPDTTVLDVLEVPPATEPCPEESIDAAEVRGLRDTLGQFGLANTVLEQLLAIELRTFLKEQPTIGGQVDGYL
jgi:hypothetical protein